jgi:hypothetical protein
MLRVAVIEAGEASTDPEWNTSGVPWQTLLQEQLRFNGSRGTGL